MLLSATIAMAQYRISTDNGTFSIQDLSNTNDYGTPYPKEKIFGHQISATRVSVKIEGVTYNPKLLIKNQGIEYTDFRDGNNSDATFASAAAVDSWFKQNTGFKTSAGGSADGVVSNVTLSGSELQFTGSNGGFNGDVDLSVLVGGGYLAPLKETDYVQRWHNAFEGTGSLTFILTGDSTFDNDYSESVNYWDKQLSKIGVDFVDNAQAGQRSDRWATNQDGNTVQQAIDATSGTGESTIMLFGFGINNPKTDETAFINGIISDINVYKTAKPDAQIVLFTPIDSDTRPRGWYYKISEQTGYPIVDVNAVMDLARPDPVLYQDVTHPTAQGTILQINATIDQLVPQDIVRNITLEEYRIEPYIGVVTNLAAGLVENGSYGYNSGLAENNSNARRLAPITVEPSKQLKVVHQGATTSQAFAFDSNGDFIRRISYNFQSGNNYGLINLPENATEIRIILQISDGASYDALNDVPIVEYVEEPIVYSQNKINENLKLRQPLAISGSVSEGSSNLSILSDDEFDLLSSEDKIAYRGFRSTNIGLSDLYSQDDAASSADVNSVGGWTVVSPATVTVETTITDGSNNAIRLSQVADAGSSQRLSKVISNLSPNTTYTFGASFYKSGWQDFSLRIHTDASPGYNLDYTIRLTAENTWVRETLEFTTGENETDVELVMYTNTNAVNGQFGIVDNISVFEKIDTQDFEEFGESLVSYKDGNSSLVPIKVNGKDVYFDNSNSNLETNNAQVAIQKLEEQGNVLFGMPSYDYHLEVLGLNIIATPTDKSKPQIINTDLKVIVDQIYSEIVTPFINAGVNGKASVSLKFGKGVFNYYNTIEIDGPYPLNTEGLFVDWVMIGDGHPSTEIKFNTTLGADGWVFSKGMRIRIENMKFTTQSGNGRLLYCKAPATNGGYSIRDSYINNVHVRGNSIANTPLVEFENFFSITVPRLKVLNFGGDCLYLTNNSSTTNYGNSQFGKVNISSGGQDNTYGLKVRTLNNAKIMNLLTFNYLEVGTTIGEGSGSNAIGVHFERTSNIFVNMLTSEYVGRNVLIENSSNIIFGLTTFTIERANDQLANEAFGFKVLNSQGVKSFNGVYYTTDYTAAPLIIDSSFGKAGNSFTGQLVNGFTVDKIQYNTPNYAELHYHEDGTLNRLDVYPDNLPIRGQSVGTTAERPSSPIIPHRHFDTDLGYWITWNGTNWVDGSGTIR